MADAYTSSSLNSVQAAFEQRAFFALRSALYFDQVADVKPTNATSAGSTVKFNTYTDLSVATTALNESVDVDAVAISDGLTTVTLVERGNAAITTAKLRGTSFLPVDANAADIIGYNAGISLDSLAREPLGAGTNVLYGGGKSARNTVVPTDTMTAALARRVAAELKGGEAMPWMDGLYRGFMHPDVSYDFRGETGAAAWRDPHTYSEPGAIWNGSIGSFEGIEWIEATRAEIVSDAGSSTTLTDVYKTVVVGKQALAKAYSLSESAELPQVRYGAVTDKLQRFHPVGWYWLGGYARFREAALYRVETASTIGANS